MVPNAKAVLGFLKEKGLLVVLKDSYSLTTSAFNKPVIPVILTGK